MKKQIIGLFFLMMSCGCLAQTPINIIPLPNELTVNEGEFVFSNCTRLQCSEALQQSIQPLITKLAKAAGIDILSKAVCTQKSIIVVSIDNTIKDNEGYQLTVLPQKILLKAKTVAGIFYGAQSILQLLPEEIEKNDLRKMMRMVNSMRCY